MVRVVFFVIWTFACAQWVFCLVSLLLICAHSFLATVSETRHTEIQNRKNPSKNYCPKIDQIWLFWCPGHFLDVCFCFMSFFLVSLLLICAHSFLATLSETRHTVIQNRKNPSENSCPKIDQLWLFWCLVFFGCSFLLNEFFVLWVTYLFVIFFGYSVKNLIHSDPETKKPIRKFWTSKLINYDQR